MKFIVLLVFTISFVSIFGDTLNSSTSDPLPTFPWPGNWRTDSTNDVCCFPDNPFMISPEGKAQGKWASSKACADAGLASQEFQLNISLTQNTTSFDVQVGGVNTTVS